MIDLDLADIKGGSYLLVAEQWDEYLSKPGEPFDFKRHRRGDVVDLNVEDARRLVVAAAVIPYDRESPTHYVAPDGTVAEIITPDPAQNGLVISEEHLAVLSEQLGIPEGATSEEILLAVQRLQDEAKAAAEAAAQAQPAAAAGAQGQPSTGGVSAPDRPKSDKIEDIVDWVGSDPARAATALEGERSTKGAQARPRLVTALEAILQVGGGN